MCLFSQGVEVEWGETQEIRFEAARNPTQVL